RRRSAPRRRSPSATAIPPPPRLAENRSRQPSPAAPPALISLRSSVLSRSRLKSRNSTLADGADGHLNYTAALRCGSTRKSTTSVDTNQLGSVPNDLRLLKGTSCVPLRKNTP